MNPRQSQILICDLFMCKVEEKPTDLKNLQKFKVIQPKPFDKWQELHPKTGKNWQAHISFATWKAGKKSKFRVA